MKAYTKCMGLFENTKFRKYEIFGITNLGTGPHREFEFVITNLREKSCQKIYLPTQTAKKSALPNIVHQSCKMREF
jgi:hypothetical protein